MKLEKTLRVPRDERSRETSTVVKRKPQAIMRLRNYINPKMKSDFLCGAHGEYKREQSFDLF
jgi:hypothetical protein